MEGKGRFTKIGKKVGVGIIGLGEAKGLVKGFMANLPEIV